jgi:hypothetical protein
LREYLFLGLVDLLLADMNPKLPLPYECLDFDLYEYFGIINNHTSQNQDTRMVRVTWDSCQPREDPRDLRKDTPARVPTEREAVL